MNRRSFGKSIASACAAAMLPWKRAQALPSTKTEESYPDAIKAFVARKNKAGYTDLFLFKNRSGQWVYQLYDPAGGGPTTAEQFFLMHGKPKDDGRFKLPNPGKVAIVCGCPAIGVEYQPYHTPSELKAKLDGAFTALMKAVEA